MDHPFARLVIRSVLVCYACWGAVVVTDLVVCESRNPGRCDAQRAEVKGAATAIPATLLAWLADSPLKSSLTGRKPQLFRQDATTEG